MILDKHHSWVPNLPTLIKAIFFKKYFLSFVVLVESSRLKECVPYLLSFHMSKNKKTPFSKVRRSRAPLSAYLRSFYFVLLLICLFANYTRVYI